MHTFCTFILRLGAIFGKNTCTFRKKNCTFATPKREMHLETQKKYKSHNNEINLTTKNFSLRGRVGGS